MKFIAQLLGLKAIILVPFSVMAQCDPPTVSGNQQILCNGLPITLTAELGYTNYEWSTGTIGASTIVSTPGTYQVTVTCANGSTAFANVGVQGFTTGIATLGNGNICAGQCASASVLLTGGSDGPYEIVLDLSTGGTQTFNVNPAGGGGFTIISLCPVQTTTYSIQSVTNSLGCVAFINPSLSQTNVTVNDQPISIDGPGNICPGQNSTLTVTPANANNYVWNNGLTGSSINVNTPGTYTVTATFSAGCTETASITIGSGGNPPTIAAPTLICNGNTATLTVNNTFDSYDWSDGQAGQSISVMTGGTYTVTVTSGSCTSTATTSLTVAPIPAVTFSANPEICAGGCRNIQVNLTGSPPFLLTYQSPVTGTQIQNFNTGSGIIQVCPPASFSGDFTLEALSIVDANCVCSP